MKFTHLIAAGLMVAGLGVSSAASAQDYRGDRGPDRRYEHRDDRRYDRYEHRRDYRDHRRYYGRDRHGPRCRPEWRHHRRVTICYR